MLRDRRATYDKSGNRPELVSHVSPAAGYTAIARVAVSSERTSIRSGALEKIGAERRVFRQSGSTNQRVSRFGRALQQ